MTDDGRASDLSLAGFMSLRTAELAREGAKAAFGPGPHTPRDERTVRGIDALPAWDVAERCHRMARLILSCVADGRQDLGGTEVVLSAGEDRAAFVAGLAHELPVAPSMADAVGDTVIADLLRCAAEGGKEASMPWGHAVARGKRLVVELKPPVRGPKAPPNDSCLVIFGDGTPP